MWVLVSWPAIKPVPTTVEAWSFTTAPPGKSTINFYCIIKTFLSETGIIYWACMKNTVTSTMLVPPPWLVVKVTVLLTIPFVPSVQNTSTQ